MKKILGVALVPWMLLAACGGDGGSTEAPGNPGGNDGGVDSGGADSGSETPGGDAGGSDTPMPHGGAASDAGASSGGNVDAMGGASSGGDGAGPLPPSPVSGHISSMSGIALEGAVVTINGESTLTDKNGAFTFDEVPPTYSITVIYENEAANFHAAEIVDGLTTRDLSLRVWYARFNTSSATVLGSLNAAVAKGHEAIVQVMGEHSTSPSTALAAAATDYSLDFRWEGGGKGAVDLVGLEWATGEAGPTSYTGFARRSMEAPDGTGIIANLTLTKPAQKTVTGTLTVDGPTPPDSFLNLGPLQVPLALKAGAISVVVPETGETPSVSVGAQVGDAYATMRAPTSLAPLDLQVPEASKLILPINKAKVDLSTEFSFARPGKLAAVWWALGSWIVVHVTDQTKLKLPDLRNAGIVYDIGNDLAPWHVDSYGPAETPEELLALMDNTSPALATQVTTYTSASRMFYLPK